MMTSWIFLENTVGFLLMRSRIYLTFLVDEAGGFFQIRPHKDFVPSRGRDRLLSLSLLADLRQDHIPQPSSGTLRDPRDAYDSIRKRQESGGDPAMKRWNASIRISNFASAETSPLCVRPTSAREDFHGLSLDRWHLSEHYLIIS